MESSLVIDNTYRHLNNSEKFPLVKKELTDDEAKEYHLHKLADLSQKSTNENKDLVAVEKEFDELNERGNGESRNSKKIKETYLQRFTNEQYYAEAVLINKEPKWLVVNDGQVSIADYIPNGDEIIKPLKELSYINKPYSFGSDSEVNDYIDKAKNETLDTLYSKVKQIWKKYVDADDFHISICSADTIFHIIKILPV
jgi:hypothetical protein